jgi:hypothetical protein
MTLMLVLTRNRVTSMHSQMVAIPAREIEGSPVSPIALELTFQTTEKRITDALGPIVLLRHVQQDHVLSPLNSHHQAG